jgi:transcriptional regulator of nitric oxide reductase
MATFQAIVATGNAIRNLLAEACPPNIFPGAQFRLCQAGDLVSSPFTDLGVSIYFYRVSYNPTRRKIALRRRPTGERFKPSVPLDLHFLVTAWARTPEQQWALLAWTIRAFEDTSVLPAGLLNQNAGSGTGVTQPNVFSEDESVELVAETLSLQEMVSVWEIAKSNQQPSVSIVARSVLIDSAVEVAGLEPLQTRGFESG